MEERMTVTEAQVLDVLRPVEDPELHRSIVDLGMVRGIDIAGGDVSVKVALTIAGCPLRSEIDRRVSTALLDLPGVTGTATPRVARSPSRTRRPRPAGCSSRRAKAAWASPPSPPTSRWRSRSAARR